MKFAISVRLDERMQDKPREGAYTDITMPVIQQYAKSVNADLVYLSESSECEIGDGRWHYRILELFDLYDKYDRILNLDADILINKNCPNLFDIVPYNRIGSILEDKGSRKLHRRQLIMDAQKKFGYVGWLNGYINTGVFLTSKIHRDIFQKINGQFWTGFGFDDLHLGYQIQKYAYKIYELDYRYNHMTMFSEKWNKKPNRLNSYIIHYAGNGVFEKKLFGKEISRLEQIRKDYKTIYA